MYFSSMWGSLRLAPMKDTRMIFSNCSISTHQQPLLPMESVDHTRIIITKKTKIQVFHIKQGIHVNSSTCISFVKIIIQVPKLYWTKMKGGREISFDGVPLSVDKVSVLDCQYGEQ